MHKQNPGLGTSDLFLSIQRKYFLLEFSKEIIPLFPQSRR